MDISSRGLDSVGAHEKKTSRAERLPDDWRLPIPWGDWAMRSFGWMREQVVDQAERFADYWHAAAGRNAVKLDWYATWRNWCRRARDQGDVRSVNGMRRDEARRHAAKVLTGYDPLNPSHRDVLDLPPEDVHVVDQPKH